MSDGYFETRFTPDSRREALWRALVDYHFQAQVDPSHTVLELGAGFGHFINNIQATRRIALDQWESFPRYLKPGIESHVGPVSDLSFLVNNSVDFVMASNLFEHVPRESFACVLKQLKAKLRPGGTINLLQPNYRFAFREYFDDYTHTTIYSDISLADFLRANGYDILYSQPRFMPLTIKSRFPVSSFLIRMYLLSPIKPMGKQMLLQATPARPR